MPRQVGLHLRADERTAVEALLRQGLNISQVASHMGITRSSVRRVRDRMGAALAEPAPAAPASGVRLGGSPESRRIVQLEDEVRRIWRDGPPPSLPPVAPK